MRAREIEPAESMEQNLNPCSNNGKGAFFRDFTDLYRFLWNAAPREQRGSGYGWQLWPDPIIWFEPDMYFTGLGKYMRVWIISRLTCQTHFFRQVGCGLKHDPINFQMIHLFEIWINFKILDIQKPKVNLVVMGLQYWPDYNLTPSNCHP